MEQNLFGNKPVLITGASGMLGAHLMRSLLLQNVKVRAFVRNESSKQKALKILSRYTKPSLNTSLIEWSFGNITDFSEVLAAVTTTEYVFHCAGFVSFNKRDTKELYDVNVVGTANIVNAALECNITKLCHVSSISALGKSEGNQLITESCDFEKSKHTSPYNYTKYLGELEVWRGIAEGLPAVIVNPSVIMGPGDWKTSSSKLFSVVANGIKYYTTGIMGYVCVQDVVDCMMQLMQSKLSGERYIVSSENLDFYEIFFQIASSLGVAPPEKLARPWQICLYARYLHFLSFFTGKSPQITRQTAKTAFSVSEYSNEKICKALSFTFRPMAQEIHSIGNMFIYDTSEDFE